MDYSSWELTWNCSTGKMSTTVTRNGSDPDAGLLGCFDTFKPERAEDLHPDKQPWQRVSHGNESSPESPRRASGRDRCLHYNEQKPGSRKGFPAVLNCTDRFQISPGAIRIIDPPIACHKLACCGMSENTWRKRRGWLIKCSRRGTRRHASSPRTWRLDIPGWSIAFWCPRSVLVRALVSRWHSIRIWATSELTTWFILRTSGVPGIPPRICPACGLGLAGIVLVHVMILPVVRAARKLLGRRISFPFPSLSHGSRCFSCISKTWAIVQ